MAVKVTIVGAGTIGYRVLQTALLQGDIEVMGITKRNFDDAEGQYLAKNYGQFIFPVSDLENKIMGSDVVVDCTDKALHLNMPIYLNYPNLKVIIQGGEDDKQADMFFNSYINYDAAKDARILQINSCNDTNFIRIYHALSSLPITFGVWSLCRRSADPKDSKSGPVNALDAATNTHHAKHVMRTLTNLPLVSNAYKAPVTEMHAQIPTLASTAKVSVDDVVAMLSKVPRIVLVSKNRMADDKKTPYMPTTAEIREYGRKLNHSGRFGDIYESVIWKDLISVNEIDPFRDGRKLYLISIPTAVHQESIVIPDNIDAIRALSGTMAAQESIAATDRNLSIGKGW